jgi:FkbM family methyltransferase
MQIARKILNNVKADLNLLFCRKLTVWQRVNFIFSKYFCVFLDKRNINYLGKRFYYDTRLAPVILQFYPEEIVTLAKYINFNKVKIVYDVGANIGQWAYTVKSFFPETRVYSFEPNRVPFEKLMKNVIAFDDWKAFNFGIGKKTEKKPLYFADNSTVGGSFQKDVAGEFLGDAKMKKTQAVIEKLDSLTRKKYDLPEKIDLLKIDVEGTELEVLESLRDLKFNYLVIEVPIKSIRSASTAKIDEIIYKTFKKKPNLLAIEPIGDMGIVANAIYEIK